MSDVAMTMPEGVQIAIIGAASSIGLALIGGIFKVLSDTKKTVVSVKKDTKASRYQVENDHDDINLREDVDNKHNIVMSELSAVNSRMTGHLNRLNNVDTRFDRMEDMLLHIILGDK